MDSPTRNNFIAIPDASGVLVVQARAPLFINNTGIIELDQSQIVQVGQLAAGSIGRTFGETSCSKKHSQPATSEHLSTCVVL